jgi:twinkle protein
MKEINGFKIEKFNQYDLDQGLKKSTCPLCSKDRKKKTDKCLMIDWNRGLATCQHCGEVLQLHTYQKKEQERTYVKPEFKNNTNLSDRLVKWFESRKISQGTLKLMKICEGPEWMPQLKKETNTIQFNYFRDNELINVKYRDGSKNFKLFKDAEKTFYNLDHIRTSKDCIIVEGEIDCLSFIECGIYHCVSTPNGSTLKGVNLDYLDNSIEYFENKDRVYLALDNDEPGQNVQNEIIRRLGPEKCHLVDLEDCNDPNEYHIKYGAERLRRTIEIAKQAPLCNVITLNDIKSQLHDFYANGSPKGHVIGLKKFDEVFSTYRKMYIVVTGIPTHGKSDFVDQMAIGYNLQNGWKGAYCSVENDPKYLHIDKLCRKLAGIRPSVPDNLKQGNWPLVEDHVNDNFFFVDYSDGYDLKKVLNKVRELVLRKGIKFFVLDPYNKIKLKESSNKSINDYTNDYLLEIDTFCRQYDLLCLLVMHPIKMHKVNGITPEPDMYSIKGGGEVYDMTPQGLLVHRDFDREIVKVKVLKCKFQNLGLNGAECYFKWNTVNGRYTPITNEVDSMTSIFNFKYDYSNWLVNEDPQTEFNINQGIEPDEDPFKEIDDELMPF